MAKRFITTVLFDDTWFMSLSKNGKLLWMYAITKCDHAGIIEINPDLCTLQTGIEEIDSAINEIGNRFMPLVHIPEQNGHSFLLKTDTHSC